MLAFTVALPGAPIISGALIVHLTLALGLKQATLRAMGGAALIGGLLFAMGQSAQFMLLNAAIIWVPVALLAAAAKASRSLTFALQVSVLGAIILTAGFFIAVGDPVGFWLARIDLLIAEFRTLQLVEVATFLETQREQLAAQGTMLFVFMRWIVAVLVLLLGYALFQRLPDQRGRFGQFRDLSLGRVLAMAMALASVLTLVVDSVWIQNMASIMFAVFCIQGIAVVHSLHAAGRLPKLVVVTMYILLPILNSLLVMVLAVLGYIDVWFNLRARTAAARNKS